MPRLSSCIGGCIGSAGAANNPPQPASAAGGGGNSGGGAAEVKAELQPHPVKEQLPGIQFCVNSPPPWPEAVLLGFQHYILTLGITVLIPSLLVPQMGGGNDEKATVIQAQLFASGVSTLLQTLFGTRLPSVAVGSCAYMLPVTSILLGSSYRSITDPKERFKATMRGVQGAMIIAGCFQIAVGFLGLWRNVARLLTPLSIAPFVTCTGLGLYYLGFPMMAKCIEVGIPALIAIVFISQHLPSLVGLKRPICDRYAVLLSVPLVWLYAQILTSTGAYNGKPEATQDSCRTDRAGLVSSTPWIYVPYPFQWGRPTFSAGEVFTMMAASLVTLFESSGAFFAAARYGSATPVPPSVLSRGIGWLGLGVLFNGLLGSVTGSSASVENTGLLAMTRVGSRRVIQVSACFMIFFSIFGKLGAVFASIPLPIVAALYCVFCGYAGLGFLQFCNLNSFRTKFVLGFSFFMGISVPQYFREYVMGPQPGHVQGGSRWFKDIPIIIFMSHATVAALSALLLDCTLQARTDSARKDSGTHWWEKFNLYWADIRSDDFYALPCCLNEFFPSL
ncbi:hypothetical protein CDL15_Pgr006637 [Punica granatum]|uniref:Nucleobase-ascorbate transporter 10 n=1 Tax=Punica granatum TaxID=22663 RepID=A0A218X6N0_PUNGR|nr:hypothetical protein CDL15_Pgr006637 [Punica granatum]